MENLMITSIRKTHIKFLPYFEIPSPPDIYIEENRTLCRIGNTVAECPRDSSMTQLIQYTCLHPGARIIEEGISEIPPTFDVSIHMYKYSIMVAELLLFDIEYCL